MNTERKQWGKRMTSETRARLDAILPNYQDTDALINAALDALEAQSKEALIELSDDEVKLVSKAVTLSGKSKSQLMKTGLIAECKRSVTQGEKYSLETLSDEELRFSTVRGAASIRIAKTVDHLMHFNYSQEDRKNRIAITESVIAELTGSNRPAIKQYFRDNVQDIQTHMIEMQLAEIIDGVYKADPTINRKGKGFDLKQFVGL